MNIEQAINYLKSSGMSDEQIRTVVDAFTCEDAISRQAVEDAIANTIVNGERLGYAVAYDILAGLPLEKAYELGQTSADCISRQAVICYVKAHIHEIITESGIDKNEHTNRVLRAIMNGVETMPSVTPKTDILVEIRTEIEQLPTQTRTNWNGCCPDIDYPEIEYVDVTKHKLLSIIDKYKAESEDEK